MKKRAMLLVLMALSSTALAHKDMRLGLADNGGIQDLPDAYSPASLDIVFSKNGKPPIASAQLTLGSSKLVFPRCLTEQLPTTNLEQIALSGSWYHSGSRLPPYMSIRFHNPAAYGDNHYGNPEIDLLINLQTAKIIRLGGNTKTICTQDELKPLMDTNRR
jgi:hypothetical protein